MYFLAKLHVLLIPEMKPLRAFAVLQTCNELQCKLMCNCGSMLAELFTELEARAKQLAEN